MANAKMRKVNSQTSGLDTSGYTAAGMQGRAQGESEDDWKRRQVLQTGDVQRQAANANGIDTSGMYWKNGQWQDADERHWYSDPRVLGPLAVAAGSAGLGMFAGPGAAAPALAGTGGAPTAASTAGGTLPATFSSPAVSGVMSVAPAAGTGAGTGVGAGAMNFFKGLDPTSLILGGLSLFGGDEGGQERQSFKGGATDPRRNLEQLLRDYARVKQGVMNQGPPRLRNTYTAAPKPISIPGLPFQIGGGLGRDPAIDRPELLEGQGLGSSFGQTQPEIPGQPLTAKQRKP